MTELIHALCWQYPTLIVGVDVALEDRQGSGATIVFWNAAKLGTQPTPAQIATWLSPANAAAVAADVVDKDKDAVVKELKDFKRGVLEMLFFDIEKRLRVLEGKPTITLAQYRTGVKNALNGP